MIPLAERLRPKTLNDWVGHEEVMGSGKPLREMIETDHYYSFILYAPPGVGKTSLTKVIKASTRAYRLISLNAVSTGVKEVKELIEGAKLWEKTQNQKTILFIDEIHRFNKGQQDSLLGAVEKGDVTLIGATTENPSYELNAALISRCKVFRMEALTPADLQKILSRAVEVAREEWGEKFTVETGALDWISENASGDARSALNFFEWALPTVTLSKVKNVVGKRTLQHDKTGDLHHQIVSAFIKSMRASETEAALYYLARLWDAGEDPSYMARRMLIFASEDIGNADIRALAVANAVRQAVEFVGRPECFYALSQGVIFLSKAPKSREAGDRFKEALEKVEKLGHASPPNFLVNANTKLDRELGRGSARKDNESYLPGSL